MDEGIFKISRDLERAMDLLEIAQDRINYIIPSLPKDKYYKILEEYYEAIVQLLTAIMYLDGYKTLSHISLIKYLSDNYKNLSKQQIILIDQMRKLRHGTFYYGKKINQDFFINNEADVKLLISTLVKLVKSKFNIK